MAPGAALPWALPALAPGRGTAEPGPGREGRRGAAVHRHSERFALRVPFLKWNAIN